MESKLEENKKYLALWVNFYIEEDNDIIGWYDHDYEESYSVDQKKEVEEIVKNMVDKEEIQTQIIAVLNKFEVTSIEHVFALYRHCYNDEPGFLELSKKQSLKMNLKDKSLVPIFVGNFKYKD